MGVIHSGCLQFQMNANFKGNEENKDKHTKLIEKESP